VSPEGYPELGDEVAGDPAMRVFISVPAIPARLLVFGAADLTAAVASLGTFAGYRVTVCDARSVFATQARFHDAAEVINEWPRRYLAREATQGGSMGEPRRSSPPAPAALVLHRHQ